MRGSPVYQINQLWQKSGINRIGTSRHAAKAEARSELVSRRGSCSSSDVAKQIGIHSYGTADAYRDVWISIAKHARTFDGTRDIDKLSEKHIQSFLSAKVADGVKIATYQQYAAAAQKLAVALNAYSKKSGTGQYYSFDCAIKEVSKTAKTSLEKFSGSRAYSDPLRVIKAISNPEHRFAAQLQLSSGVRVSEVALIKSKQLQGIKTDPYTGKERGYFEVFGKGGKKSIHHADSQIYGELCSRLQSAGEFRIDKGEYRQSIQDACTQTGIAYHSTHGFRWCYAADRTDQCIAAGNSYDKSLACVAMELAHNRTSITEHYRK